MSFDRGQLPDRDEPWGFRGGRREVRNVQADSRVFYVDENNTLANDDNTGEDPAYPLLTITQAVTNCRAYKGDTIFVLSNDGWTYGGGSVDPIQETVVIPATKSGIKLIGIGGGALGVYWMPGVAGETCLTIYALDVVVIGFAFTGDGAAANGIYCEWNGTTMLGENTIIAYCFFDESIDIAIQLEWSWFCSIHHCYFQECDTYGIYADAGGSATAYNQIHDNYFTDVATAAIALLGSSDNNSIHDNRVYGDPTGTNNFIDLTDGDDNIVAGNYLNCSIAQYDTTCSDATSGGWLFNHCDDGPPLAPPT